VQRVRKGLSGAVRKATVGTATDAAVGTAPGRPGRPSKLGTQRVPRGCPGGAARAADAAFDQAAGRPAVGGPATC
jgi:hypothetical protein